MKSFKHPPTPPAIDGNFVPTFVPDPTLEEAEREFYGDNQEPAWALKPGEKVCSECWLVQPCDCAVAA